MAYFAMVNTWFNADNEPITERLVPEPINWDNVEFPPSPKGSPPRSFVPADEEEPEYLAYVPKDADPGFESLEAESVSVHRVDERKKEEIAKRYKRMAAGERPNKSYLDEEAPKKRKLDEIDSSDELPGDAASPLSRKKAIPKRRKAASKDKENVELQGEH